ncbi:MAG: hypothetical protein ACE5LB_03795, partial [Acidiferrobacterales bacterium]
MFPSQRVVITPRWQSLLRTHQLNDFTALYGLSAGVVVEISKDYAKGRFDSVRRLTLLDRGQTKTFYLKKSWFLQPTLRRMLRGTFFFSSMAKREYHFLRALGEGGLDVATPVAYGEE